jgi:pimeloyl-ACP methyl ester carboxylesterase
MEHRRTRRLHPRQPDRRQEREADDRGDASRPHALAGDPITSAPGDPFVNDFVTDVMPYVEKNYRVFDDRTNTAIAGLSMGGSQTLNIAMAHPNRFAYIGVYSSGLLGVFPVGGRGGAGAPAATGPADWETHNAAALNSASMKKGLKLFWFSTGKDDFLLDNTVATVALFKKHGFTPVYKESSRRSHVAELARLSERVRAAVVPRVTMTNAEPLPCIITVAITGSVPRKENNPAVPITVTEQIESTHEAFEAGAALVHVHVRNDDQSTTSDPDKFAEFQERIRKLCHGIIVQFSTGGRSGVGSERGGMLHHRPDMASLSTGSVNFRLVCMRTLPISSASLPEK